MRNFRYVETKDRIALEAMLKDVLKDNKKAAPCLQGMPFPTESFFVSQNEMDEYVDACQKGLQRAQELLKDRLFTQPLQRD